MPVIEWQWRIEIGEDFAHDRDAVVAGGGELSELIGCDHGRVRETVAGMR